MTNPPAIKPPGDGLALVEELRMVADGSVRPIPPRLLVEAAAEITRLREALEPFVRHGRACGAFDGDEGPFWIMTDTGRRDVPAEDFRRARTTLGDGK